MDFQSFPSDDDMPELPPGSDSEPEEPPSLPGGTYGSPYGYGLGSHDVDGHVPATLPLQAGYPPKLPRLASPPVAWQSQQAWGAMPLSAWYQRPCADPACNAQCGYGSMPCSAPYAAATMPPAMPPQAAASQTHQDGGAPQCMRNDCRRPTYNGLQGYYCGRTCQNLARQVAASVPLVSPVASGNGAQSAAAVQHLCQRSGCQNPTWDGEPGYCSTTCRDAAPLSQATSPAAVIGAPPAPASVPCRRKGCPKPSHDGTATGWCTKTCREQDLKEAGVPLCANPRCGKHNLSEHICCSQACRKSSQVHRVPEGSKRFAEAHNHFVNKWKTEMWNGLKVRPPDIDSIYEFYLPDQEKAWKAKQLAIETLHGSTHRLGDHSGPGNSNRRFHGTRSVCNFSAGKPCTDPQCFCCQIIAAGKFSSAMRKQQSGNAKFGDGFYFTTKSHTAKGYGLADKSKYPPNDRDYFVSAAAGNVIFICDVLVGKAEKRTAAAGMGDLTQSWAQPDEKDFDSRIVDKPDTGNDELIVWGEDQVLPKFLVIFKGPGKSDNPIAKPHPMIEAICQPAKTSVPCVAGAKCVKGGSVSWTGQPWDFCSKPCRDKNSPGMEILRSDPKFKELFEELEMQLKAKWRQDAAPATPPPIKKIYSVWNPKLEAAHEAYCKTIGKVPKHGFGKDPGNQQRNFHQTILQCNFAGTPCADSSCCVCSIIKTGFLCSKAKRGRFGDGVYSTSTPSKAYAYGNKKAMFVVNVACGIPEISSSTGAIPAGNHSRIVNNADDECVVQQDPAMVPRYLLLF
mmetsp:Transcript_26876/g.49422  ORF Transcript_26876/g.49422 Transcript_26876/m.49422 type:complete len:791 (-) Transcript_26876:217-2589(-)